MLRKIATSILFVSAAVIANDTPAKPPPKRPMLPPHVRKKLQGEQPTIRQADYQEEVEPVQPPPKPTTPTHSGGYSLDQLEQLALQSNPTLAQATAGIEAKEGDYQQAGLYPNPQIGYVNGSASPSSERQSNGGFVSQEFVTARKLQLAQAQEQQELNRVSWEAEAQRYRVINDVRLRFYEALGAQQAVVVTKRLEKIAEEGLTTIQDLFSARQASRIDVSQAQVQLETVRLSREEAEERLIAAWQQLASVVGEPDLPISELTGSLEENLPVLSLPDSWQKLIANSPQIFSSQSARDQALAECELARAQVTPNVTVQAIVEYDRATQSTTASTLFALPLPLFNRNQGNIRRTEANIRGAESEIQRVKLVLRDQLADSFRRYNTSRKQTERMRKVILPATKQNVTLTAEGFKGGETTFLQVITARQSYFEASLAYIEAMVEMRKVIVEIEGLQLTGGLNPAEIGTAIQSQGGGGSRQRALLQKVQEGAGRQLLPAAQLGR